MGVKKRTSQSLPKLYEPQMDGAAMIGRRFGRFTVIEEALRNKHGHRRLKCLCDCGSVKVVGAGDLKRGIIVSCGCYKIERSITHNMSKSREYVAWKSMKDRCIYPKSKSYADYGGRGITICDRWLNSFENFYKDMGDIPDNKSLDRINTDGNYEPGNCRWATLAEQANNRRSNRKVTYNGQTKTITQWSIVTGIKLSTISKRLSHGWSEIDAVTKPIQGKK